MSQEPGANDDNFRYLKAPGAQWLPATFYLAQLAVMVMTLTHNYASGLLSSVNSNFLSAYDNFRDWIEGAAISSHFI